MAFNFGTTPTITPPPTGSQWNAIQLGANNNSLVNQLYAGKPATQTPPVTAASTAVKNQNAPVSSPAQPTYAGGTNAQGQGIGSIIPSGAPTTQLATPPTQTFSTVNPNQNLVTPPTPPATFSGILGSLYGTSAGGSTQGQGITQNLNTTAQQGNPTEQNAVGQTLNYGAGNIPLEQNAENISGNYSNQIAQTVQAANQGGVGMLTSGALNPVALGRSNAIETAAGEQEQGLAAAEEQALAGNAQALTGQNQAAAAANEAAGQANTAQSNIQSGEANAGNLANTAQANVQSGEAAAGALASPGNAYIQVPFNQQLVGADGQPIGGASGSGQLQSAVVNAINLIKSGSGYSNAIAAANLGQFGPQGTTALLNALGPKFNVNSSDADAAAVAQNINTSATAQTTANANAVNSLTGTVADLSAARDSVANIANNLISQLATSNNLNPSNINAVNGLIQTIAGQTSNPQYQTLLNQMTDVVNTYAQILSPGANTDASKATAQGLLNSLAQGSTVQQVVSGLDAQAQAKISGSQTALQNIKSGTNPNPATSLTGQTVTAPDGTSVIITD